MGLIKHDPEIEARRQRLVEERRKAVADPNHPEKPDCAPDLVLYQAQLAQDILEKLDVEPEDRGAVLSALIQALAMSSVTELLSAINTRLLEIGERMGVQD